MEQINTSQRSVLIDLDGTLIDTAPDIFEAVSRMLNDLKAEALPYQTVCDFIGKGVPNLVHRVLIAAKITTIPDADACAIFYRHYRETNGHFGFVFPGVHEGLIAMKEAGFRLGCVTNKPFALAEPLLQIAGLDGYFDVLVGGDSLPFMKPAPEPLYHACEVMGTLPERAVMVGDSESDVASARAASMPVYIVNYGYPGPAGLSALKCDGFIDSLLELAQQLSVPAPVCET
ncbi:phosphoglycolate phosphatase [Glaciimonas immobilis]|uniref:Phosphoglycolate phosphatase n=1 Tax=Glaciimonas immobilis TaxID=728004 RepID=A0A840RYD9_9BURK|nr:phosphoglycolate phosphatase [Glaciimonas immobilis]KAF3998661.1 phosphoglycolate phosphatase [Glaciimonas immobilis]MBB5201531.1 phosphoglycolate phosphatase [Glaciimonas immobilis]